MSSKSVPPGIFPKAVQRPMYYRVIEFFGFFAFVWYQGLFLINLAKNISIVRGVWGFVGLFFVPLAAYILADFASGAVHFFGDTFGSEKMPVLGPNFFAPFREHHVDEKAITRHDFFEVNGTNCLGSLLALVPVYYFFDFHSSVSRFLFAAMLWFFFLFIFLTNQIHRAAHLDKVSTWVAWLQRQGLILSPVHHQVHHTAPFRTYFCITSGWLNPILSKTGIFDFIARLSRAVRLEKAGKIK